MSDDDSGAAQNECPQQPSQTLFLPRGYGAHQFPTTPIRPWSRYTSSASGSGSALSGDTSSSGSASALSRDTSPSHSGSALSRDTSPSRNASALSRDTSPSRNASPSLDASASPPVLSTSHGFSLSAHESSPMLLSHDASSGDALSPLQDTASRNTLSMPGNILEQAITDTNKPIEKEPAVDLAPRESPSSSGISTLSGLGSEDPTSSSSISSLVSSKVKLYGSSNNSSPSRGTCYYSDDTESATGTTSATEDTDTTANNSYFNFGADGWYGHSESDFNSGKESLSISTSLPASTDESSDYEQYACRRNRNINAKKRKKSKSGESSDKEPLVGKRKDKNKSDDASASEKGGPEKAKEGDKQESKGKGKGSHKRRRSSRRRSSKGKGKGKGGKGGKHKKHGDDRRRSSAGKSKGSNSSGYPNGAFFILGGEFCERFAYYGIRSVLIMYLTGWLAMEANEAVVTFHMFSCVAYISPILGAVLADSALGRYKTILVLCMVYAMGCFVLAATALPPRETPGPLVGLFLVSFGTGGMKPCVVTFGGEQLPRDQFRRRATFFSTFYFVINLGSVTSILITPVLRSDVKCVGDTCYPLAFGVPAGLMMLAACVFLAGYKQYRFTTKTQSNFSRAIAIMCGCSTDEPEVTKSKDAEKGKGRKGKKDKKKDRKKHSRRGSRRASKSKDKDKEDKPKDGTEEKDKDKDAKKGEEDKGAGRKKSSKGKKKRKKKKKKDANKSANPDNTDTNQNKDEGEKSKDSASDDKRKEKKEKKKQSKKSKGKSHKSGRRRSKKPSSHHGNFAKDVKMVKRILWLFIPLPIFWALFNQQGSRWTIQAAQLDGKVGNYGRIKPDQMQALNPLLIILFIPIFERVVYPCINSCGLCKKALHRMVAGMIFCGLAFILTALLQTTIDQSSELPLHNGQAGYIIMNTMDCKINVRGSPAPFFDGTVAPFAQTEFARVLPGSKNIWVFCPTSGLQTTVSANLSDQKAFRLIVTAQPGQISVIVTDDMRNKVMNGTGYVSFLHLLAWVDQAKIQVTTDMDKMEPMTLTLAARNTSAFHVFEPGSYEVALPSVTNATGWEKVGKSFEVGEGGVYTVALIDPATFIDLVNVVVETYKDVKENSVSMALMIPQYLLITIAEILFSISGLAFAYSQAPESMKSVIQTFWLLTSAFGDLIVIIVSLLPLPIDQKTEYFAYAGLMFVDALIFMVLIRFYKYIDPAKFHKPRKSKKGKKKGHRSKGASGGKHGKGHGKRRSSSK